MSKSVEDALGSDMPGGCVFCSAPGGEVLWQSDLCRVVLTREQEHPLLLRVILTRHRSEMTELLPEERAHLMHVVFAAEQVLRQVVEPQKINLASLGNVVPHVHWHVIPRWQDDAFYPRSIWSAALRAPSETDMIALHRLALRQQLAELLK